MKEWTGSCLIIMNKPLSIVQGRTISSFDYLHCDSLQWVSSNLLTNSIFECSRPGDFFYLGVTVITCERNIQSEVWVACSFSISLDCLWDSCPKQCGHDPSLEPPVRQDDGTAFQVVAVGNSTVHQYLRVLCDKSRHGGGWLRVFYHDVGEPSTARYPIPVGGNSAQSWQQ